MKKSMYLVAGLLTIGLGSAFTSCSNDEDINPGMEQVEEGTQVLTLSVANGGDGLQSRAGRPLLSNEAAQQIDNVALYFVNEESKIVLTRLIDWSLAKPYADGMQQEIALKGDQKLKDEGSYTVYAVGYSKDSEYTFTPTKLTDDNDTYSTDGAESWDKFQVTLGQNQKDAEEIFAGSTTVTVAADGSFNLTANNTNNSITLHRQVAGITGYLTNIPVSVNDVPTASVRLVSVAKNTCAQFGHFYTKFTDNAANEETASKYIMNGTTSATKENGVTYADGTTQAYEIFTIKLTDWWQVKDGGTYETLADCDLDKDGFLGYKDVQKFMESKEEATSPDAYKDIWVNPYSDKAKFVRGSIFSGKFVIPFAKHEAGTVNTLQLQLLDASGNILKYWNINADKLHTAKSDNDEDWELTDHATDKSIYNIYRNHMYNIGMKATVNPGGDEGEELKPTDPDPEEPDDEEDENPEDLSKGQNLILMVNDNWELIHQMVVD